MNLVDPDPQRSILLYCIVYIPVLFAEERLLVVLYNAHRASYYVFIYQKSFKQISNFHVLLEFL